MPRFLNFNVATLTALASLLATVLPAAEHPATAYRRAAGPVTAQPDGNIICEAEEFQVTSPGWQAKAWGENYYCATFANSFLSRKAFLGAPEQCEKSAAEIRVHVEKPGKYLVLARYEAPHRFESRFHVEVEQGGRKLLNQLYGARENIKIWAFKQKRKAEVAWSWGAGENMVWEGYPVELAAGAATVRFVSDKQPEDAGQRNVDLVLLTPNLDDVEQRIEKENYLPLDGLLTQDGDVHVKVTNAGQAPLLVHVPKCVEHSPYWVHIRAWKPRDIVVPSGQASGWEEVGTLLDSLSDGQWTINARAQDKKDTAPLKFHLEFGLRTAQGQIAPLAKFDNLTGDVTLAYDADTRYSRRLRRVEQVLYDLVDYLKARPVRGQAPKRTLIYGYTMDARPGDDRYQAAIEEFVRLIGGTALSGGSRKEFPLEAGVVRGYTDVRGQTVEKLSQLCEQLKAEGKANTLAVVSLGDEIGLAAPPATDHAAFRTWLQARGLKPVDVVPAAGNDWEKVQYSPQPEIAATQPRLHYYTKTYRYRFGIARQKSLTDVLRQHLPNAGIGANFSPHHGHMYIGPTHQWISLFREEGMTMPWGEDYIWQVPVCTQQVNTLMVDMFRAGIRGKPKARIHYYVMPHTPGNTTSNWRRQFYGDMAHGVKEFNLFEFRPVQLAYTENHCSDPAMFQEVRRTLHELGTYENFVQDGQVRGGVAALWFSEAADVWDDLRPPFDAAKRTLYIAAIQQQLTLDVVIDGDDLKPYQVLYLADQHVSRAASQAISDWVQGGGRLLATAGAGMFDEFNQPNEVLAKLLGVEQQGLVEAPGEPIQFEKQHLPFARPIEQIELTVGAAKLPVFGLRAKLAARDAEVQGKFSDGSPAVTARKHGAGTATYAAFLPGLSYFQPALEKRPVDRGAHENTMSHFIPTRFDAGVTAFLGEHSKGVARPVECSERLVHATIIESPHGVLVPLVNWSAGPVKPLTISLRLPLPPGKPYLASGGAVKVQPTQDGATIELDLDVADAVVLPRRGT